jgi:hypothetical protein
MRYFRESIINFGIYKTSISGDIGTALGDVHFPQLKMFVAPETKLFGDVNAAFTKDNTPVLKKLNFLKVTSH